MCLARNQKPSSVTLGVVILCGLDTYLDIHQLVVDDGGVVHYLPRGELGVLTLNGLDELDILITHRLLSALATRSVDAMDELESLIEGVTLGIGGILRGL